MQYFVHVFVAQLTRRAAICETDQEERPGVCFEVVGYEPAHPIPRPRHVVLQCVTQLRLHLGQQSWSVEMNGARLTKVHEPVELGHQFLRHRATRTIRAHDILGLHVAHFILGGLIGGDHFGVHTVSIVVVVLQFPAVHHLDLVQRLGFLLQALLLGSLHASLSCLLAPFTAEHTTGCRGRASRPQFLLNGPTRPVGRSNDLEVLVHQACGGDGAVSKIWSNRPLDDLVQHADALQTLCGGGDSN
mmetsp:Transcript_19251/g.32219  ORF Transcript_19251/g.32219 Transcript_19251/m.32219 type:complete len:245 (+) Transcript_19251:693-1427(+)